MTSSLAVNIAIFDQGRLLLTQREDFEMWCLPGGGVDVGESLAQAAIREAREETGLEVALTRLVGVYSRPGRSSFDGHITLFAARAVGGELRTQPGETIEVRFFDPQALPDDLVPLAERRIRDALDGTGGSTAWALHQNWPFRAEIDREALYRLQAESGLSRKEFHRRTIGYAGPLGERLEIGGESALFEAKTSKAHLDLPLSRVQEGKPVAGASVAILNEGKILLTLRPDFEVWCIPGGVVEEGESIAEAARREVLEETGLEVELIRLVGVYSKLNWYRRGCHIFLFAGRATGGEMRLQEGEVLQAGYYGPSDLPEDFLYGHWRMAIEALNGVGGSAVWTQRLGWPFDVGLTRREIYTMRDRSGLSRTEFYRRNFRWPQEGDEVYELGMQAVL
jgi:ADP-ribose pyrophosphatase YjhB (NUDIX family)